jgi:hypothetical protein
MDAGEQLKAKAGCILMFSGGRDSSLAAIRLSAPGQPLTLVTVSADHLFGFERVRQRLAELELQLPCGTRWMRIRQPRNLGNFGAAFERTCLPCQHDYALAGALIAKQLGIPRLAFGYASYQSSWPEQHPTATAALSGVLGEVGIRLELPVYDLASRQDAMAKLAAAGLDDRALEQKCSRQIFNLPLDNKALKSHLGHWAQELRKSLSQTVEIDVLEEGVLRHAGGTA